MINVMVLGAGPAGLLAAHTAVEMGAAVAVFSRGQHGKPIKSELHGCQYLHDHLRLPVGDPVEVSYTLQGTAQEYRSKVYGDNWQGMVSPDEYGPQEGHMAWDIRRAYDWLWNFWQHRIFSMNYDIDAMMLESILRKAEVDVVISTIPAPTLCRQQGKDVIGSDEPIHTFLRQPIWVMGQAGSRTLPLPCPDNTVICSGDPETSWYRKARVFDRTTVEFPWRDGRKPPLSGVVQVQKPLRTNCDCFLEDTRFHRVGRFGRWEKGYLVHQVMQDVQKALTDVQPRLV